MANRRVGFLVVFLVFVSFCHCKVFTRCQLTRELLKNSFPKTFLSNWVCLVEQESDRNTSSHIVKTPRKQYYGLFQIGSEWCKEGRKGGKCNISCEALLDEDIKDDCACASKIFETEGFKYWSKWEARCKGQRLPDIQKCPDWQYPTRASPDRLRRHIRQRRGAFTRAVGKSIGKTVRGWFSSSATSFKVGILTKIAPLIFILLGRKLVNV